MNDWPSGDRRSGSNLHRCSLTFHWLVVCLTVMLASSAGTSTGASDRVHPTATQIVDLQIGFEGLYKLGCWTPISITLRGGNAQETGHVELIVADTDGVPTTVVGPPVRLKHEQSSTVSMLVRPGQAQGILQVHWITADQIRTRRTYLMDAKRFPDMATRKQPEDGPEDGSKGSKNRIPAGLPATNRLLLILGPPPGIAELVQTGQTEHPLTATRIAHSLDASRLPTRWCGYEGIDTLVLTTSEPAIYGPLLASPQRLEALAQWVDRGGRLLLFCGRSAADLLVPGGPLAGLIPGRYQRQLPLRNPLPLETFSGAEKPLPRGRFNLKVPKLTDVSGQILAFAGRRPADLPLIVRTPRRLGEILFVGVDLELPPFHHWSGRSSLLRKLLDWPAQTTVSRLPRSQASSAGGDLTAQLRAALDQHFTGIQTIPFALVALLVVGYIGLIGPGDFFFVQRLLGRMELTWLTFPLIVAGTSVGAYWLATDSKGNQLRVAQVEIVDVDMISEINRDGPAVADSRTTGLVRGTVWTHFFSPRAMRYDLTLQPCMPGNTAISTEFPNRGLLAPSDDPPETIVSWLGLPGHTLGSMQAGEAQTTLLEHGYTFGQSLQSLQDLPVQVWSTKTLNAEWTASKTPPIEIELSQTGDRLLAGYITNRLGVELTDCLLLYGRWAYYLARVGDERTVAIDDQLQPRTLKTMLTNATAGDLAVSRIADDGTVPFERYGSDVTRIVKTMMFYEAIGGADYTGALNRYQHRIDMSHVLQTDRAILLARAPGSGSQWFQADKPLKSNQDQHWLFYRFVVPVNAH
jgi:hypothetical protein